MSDYGLQAAEIQAVLLNCVEELWWAGNGSRGGQGLHTGWQFLLDQHDQFWGWFCAESDSARNTYSGSAVGRWCERLSIYTSVHVAWETAWHKIKVILLCQSSSEYHARPETGGFCAIHGWINHYCQGPVCAKIRHWWIQQRRTYPVHNSVPEFLHLITAFSCYPKWHRKLRGRFSASTFESILIPSWAKGKMTSEKAH